MKNTISATNVPFQEAIDHFKNKVKIPTKHWTDIRDGMHARAFVVAGAVKDDLLTDFHSAITAALEEGTTLEDFRKEFETIVERHGWTYNGKPGWRSRTIYDTNLRQAHMTGRWHQIQNNKAMFPYLRYVTLIGGNRRELHQQWRNTILPVDHPWWDSHYPMNGWGCKCTVESLTRRALEKRGLSVSDDPVIEMEKKTVRTPDGDVTVYVAKGVSPGFDYNPGKADMGRLYSEADKKRLQEAGDWGKWSELSKGNWKSAGLPERLPADTPRGKLREELKTSEDVTKALEKVMGAPEKVYTLPDGSKVLVNAKILGEHLPLDRSQFIEFLPELLEDPGEVWLSFMQNNSTGKVALRKRILKQFSLDKKRTVLMVADSNKGKFVGWTYYPLGKAKDVQKNRQGIPAFSR